MRRTKIVCTLGPSSGSPGVLSAMLTEGMSIARMNFSHGNHVEHSERLATLRQASQMTGRPVGVLQDLCGPKIRIGVVADGGFNIKPGDMIEMVVDPDGTLIGTPQRISTVYSNFLKDIKTGDRVMIDDGTLRLDVVSLVPGKAVCKVVVGGLLKSKKGINLPNVNISAPSVTDKDFDDLEWGLKNAVDYVALSFVRSADDIEKVRSACSKVKRPPKIVAKIERPEAIANLSDIIISADALMVARGDLGVEMDAEEVPLLQKRIIADAHRYDKPVITATQMLESMAQNPRPTRAEVSDVAGAIFDNTDAVMLSGETAAGRYPVEAVETMARIARRTERHIIESGGLRAYSRRNNASCPVDAVCLGAGAMADELNLKAIVVSSITGSTARYMSTARPSAPVIGMTNDPDAIGGMCLYWGVEPIFVPHRFTNRQEFEDAVELALSRAPIEINAGDLVVVTYGNPIGEPVPTNTVMVYPCRCIKK